MSKIARINWDNDFILYILDGHAAFRKHLEIATEFMVEFKDELEPLQEELGHDILYKRVYEKVKLLSPNGAKFPDQFRPEFERLRQKWTDKAKDIKGYHRTARLQTLQELLDETIAEPLGERYTQSNKVAAGHKDNIRDRAEGDRSQILIANPEVPIESKENSELKEYLRYMTDEQLEELNNAEPGNKPRVLAGIISDIRLNGDGQSGASSESADSNRVESGDDETAGGTPPSEKDLLDIFQETPRRIIEEKDLFVRFCEAFIYISHRTGEGAGAKAPIIFNNTQHCVINSYFDQKAKGMPVRTLGLKGRQQGFSTVVEVIAFMDTICKGGQNTLIATEHKEKSGYNIYEMFHLMLTRFPISLPTAHVQDGKRIQFDETMGRTMINVSGENAQTSYTYKFIHLSEAAFFQSLNTFLNMLLQTVLNTDKSTCIFLETTANRFGDEFHDRWVRAEEGKSPYHALFIPWFVHEEYEMPFIDDADRDEFEQSLGKPDSMDRYGDEVKLLSTPAYHVKIDDNTTIKCEVTREKLKWRRVTINDNCGGSILEFYRQYPTTSEEAFISAGVNVLDTSSLAYYRQYIQNGLKAGEGFNDHDILQHLDQEQSNIIIPIVREAIPDHRQSDKFRMEDTMQGVITVYEPYHPYKEYIMGSDHAEGLESGDFSCAYIVSRNPRRIVAKIRGYDGRRLDPEEFASQMFAMYKKHDPWVCPENNKDGGTVIVLMRQWGCNNFIPESLITGKSTGGSGVRYGWMNNQATKKQGVALLQKAIRNKEWTIPDMMLIEECQTLIYKNGKVQAARKGERRPPGSSALGYYDDCVFAFVGCLLADNALPPARTQELIREDEEETSAFYEEPALKPGETVYTKNWA